MQNRTNIEKEILENYVKTHLFFLTKAGKLYMEAGAIGVDDKFKEPLHEILKKIAIEMEQFPEIIESLNLGEVEGRSFHEHLKGFVDIIRERNKKDTEKDNKKQTKRK